jgi:hypothetical protein
LLSKYSLSLFQIKLLPFSLLIFLAKNYLKMVLKLNRKNNKETFYKKKGRQAPNRPGQDQTQPAAHLLAQPATSSQPPGQTLT